jgi:hypothetical protein
MIEENGDGAPESAEDEEQMTQTERQKKDATPAPSLEGNVEGAIDRWFGALVETVGPLVSTVAYNAIHDSRDSLKRQIAAALDSHRE